jgi:hypothetical protein
LGNQAFGCVACTLTDGKKVGGLVGGNPCPKPVVARLNRMALMEEQTLALGHEERLVFILLRSFLLVPITGGST